MSDVKGKVVALTGASSGIGEAAGRLLAESGAKVILGARRADRLEAIAADIRKNKGEADLQVIDVSKREDLTSFGPNGAVYSGTKFAVRAISEGLRQEAGDKIRVTIISPGAVESELAETISNPDVKKRIQDYRKMAIPAEAIAMAYAIGQPSNVDVNEILIRPTAQPN